MTDDEVIKSFYGVGPNKPLGCVSVNSIRNLGYDPETLVADLLARGLAIHRVNQKESGFRFLRDGGISVFDLQSLSALLSLPANQRILGEADWPQDPEGFVHATMTKVVDQGTLLYDLVADAFGHPDNILRLRKGVTGKGMTP